MATSNLLTENSRVISVTANAKDANNRYDVSYTTTTDGKTLQKLSVNIYKLDPNQYLGAMNMDEKGALNTNFNDASIDGVTMMTLFNSIIAEIKAGLTA